MNAIKRDKQLIGLELDDTHIRIVQSAYANGSVSITHWIETPLPPGACQDGLITAPEAVGSVIKKALQKRREKLPISQRNAAVAVGGQGLVVRRLILPKLPPKRLRHMLETQGDRWIPFLREGAIFDLVTINPHASQREQEVLLVALPSQHVTRLQAALKHAGLRLAALDVDVAALYRLALIQGKASIENDVAIAQIEPNRVRIGLFRDGHLVRVRRLDLASMGIVEPGRDSAYDMADLVSVEIRRSLAVMLDNLQGEERLESLVVMAPPEADVLIQSLDQELRRSMSRRLAPGFQLRLGLGPDIQAEQALALGLSLLGADQPPRAMDLLPRLSISAEKTQSLMQIAAAILVAAFAGYAVWWNTQVPAIREKQQQTQATLVRLQKELSRERDVIEEEAVAKKLQNLMDSYTQTDPWWVVFPRLQSLVPSGVQVSSVSADPPKLTIQGQASTPEAVRTFLNRLEQSPGFTNPVLQNTGLSNPASFQLTVSMAPREVNRP